MEKLTSKPRVSKVSKFVRGSIWWCKDDGLKSCEPGKQHGTRPALVVSRDQRGSCQSVEVLKITSTDKSDVCPGINIPVFMNGKQCYVLCNQHFTVTTDSLTEFIGICPQDVVEDAEKGMLRALGMNHLIEMQSKYYDLTRTVTEVVDRRLSKYRIPNSDGNREVVDVISGVISGLNVMLNNAEETLKSQIVEESKASGDQVVVTSATSEEDKDLDEVDKVIKDVVRTSETPRRGFKSYTPQPSQDLGIDEEVPKNPEESLTDKTGKYEPKNFTTEIISGVEVKRSPAGKIRWSREVAEQFIKDCEELPLSEVVKNWKLSSVKSCSQMKYLVKNKFDL